MAAHDNLPPASFAGIPFPVRSIERTGSYAFVPHHYLKTDGANQEKLRRNPYKVRMRCVFDEWFNGKSALQPTVDRASRMTAANSFSRVYPDVLKTLIGLFEKGTTAELVVPTKGALQAFCSNWQDGMDAALLSGEEVTLEFEEDRAIGFTAKSGTGAKLASYAKKFTEEAGKAKSLLDKLDAVRKGVNDAVGKVQDAANQVREVQATVSDLNRQAVSLLETAAGLCGELDALLSGDFVNAETAAFYGAFLNLWASFIDLAQSPAIGAANIQPQTFIVPITMSLKDVASRLYNGDTSRTNELYALNDIPDMLNLPAGKAITYYA